jgi:hypothetical protein
MSKIVRKSHLNIFLRQHTFQFDKLINSQSVSFIKTSRMTSVPDNKWSPIKMHSPFPTSESKKNELLSRKKTLHIHTWQINETFGPTMPYNARTGSLFQQNHLMDSFEPHSYCCGEIFWPDHQQFEKYESCSRQKFLSRLRLAKSCSFVQHVMPRQRTLGHTLNRCNKK